MADEPKQKELKEVKLAPTEKEEKAIRESVAVKPQTPPPPPMPAQTDEVGMLISQAIMQGLPVETMEKLLAMRKELKAEKAKEAFDAAMSGFQADCPVIEKKKQVMEKDGKKVRYSFAPLDDIVAQVKEPMGRHGLSYTFKTIQTDKVIGVICKATHKMGHSEDTEFSVPIGSEQFMSEVQKFGARITFAKRYAFCNAFGITTGDEDTDAVGKDQPEAVGVEEADVQKINGAKNNEALLKICTELKKKYPDRLKTLLNLYNFRKAELEAADAEAIADDVEKGLEGDKK